MKLPDGAVRAKAYRKVPSDSGAPFRIIPLSDSDFTDAQKALAKLSAEEIADAFVWTDSATLRAEDVLALMDGQKISGNPPRTHRDDWEEVGQIHGSLFEVQHIRETGILHPDRSNDPLFRSAITNTLINLSDLLAKANNAGNAMTTDDERGEVDLLEVISSARNAACHVTTRKTQVGPSTVRYGVSRGPDAGLMIHGIQLGCPYPDEVAIFFGVNRVYLRRDILAAHDRLRNHYRDLRVA